MRRLWKLTILLGVVGMTSWLGGGSAALAAPKCTELEGTVCSPPGAQTACLLVSGEPSFCTCGVNNHWRCLF